MLTILVVALLSGTPAKKPVDAPHPSETAKLFFLTGDIAKAQEIARLCLRKEPKKCGPLNRWIAEYAFLVRDIDALTPEQARELIELDAKIAPDARGKLTQKVVERFVTIPLERAKTLAPVDRKGAAQVVERVLFVEPKNVAALELQKTLRNEADAGQ